MVDEADPKPKSMLPLSASNTANTIKPHWESAGTPALEVHVPATQKPPAHWASVLQLWLLNGKQVPTQELLAHCELPLHV